MDGTPRAPGARADADGGHKETGADPSGSQRPLEEQVDAGQAGPGLAPRRGWDATLVTAVAFVVVGYTPLAWWEAALGFGHFGPIQLPAILAMVGVLFAFIALLRSIDLQDRPLRLGAAIALAGGLARLFLMPFF